MIKRIFLSSYIFYFRQNGHKVNNKCGTSCGQCGQKRVVVLCTTLFLYMPITFFVIKISTLIFSLVSHH
ncbi:hypothetical protein F8172_08700 [Bacillus cereus]|uniref:Uncharacterized protein n=1 Tax=Bacillus cereus TaxID=1396 RepID=A0A9W7QIU1_BACCE|nr:hypothetical protein F8172_08700 [Bacillus cereus]KAB2409517.1 hypothetical protein F8170_08325 [Bacillus cereus]KAB2426047.1 hypothetical protein F8168_24350 [Bacillus cereus]